jgi:MoaA/NifB/PqqE/SkfB family radical SAM enzyme
MELTSRVDINVGYSCNERCKFCYYIQTVADRKKEKDLPTEEVKKRIAYIRGQGIDVLDFTGGEPTIRPDLLDLIRYAKSLGFTSLSMITNGVRMADPAYTKACVEAGIDDFLLSIHGNEASVHDRVTGVPGSFDKVVAAANHLRSHPVKTRVNCVISGYNYKTPVETLALFHSLGIQTANFILFNPIVEADWRSDPALNVAYSDAAPYLKQAIDLYRDKIRKITVRYIPLCLMRGYEAYVTNMPQLQYDPDEWDYLIRTGIREGKVVATAALCVGMALYPFKKRLFTNGWNAFKHEGIKHFLQRKNKVYGPACRGCAYRGICDGLWRRYAEWKGFEELSTVPGPRITDPTHFMYSGDSNPNSGS